MRSAAVTLWVFAITLFTSATLLFLVQPMVGKTILLRLGGSPAVWNTCMVFFQAMLLLGYAYAHASTRWLGIQRQAWLHAGLLLLPVLVLPIGRVAQGWEPHGDVNPIPWLLGYLAVSVGLPFFVVSSSAPLLQRWFAGTGHPSAQDPYFLYGASNLGSMLALLGYPLVVEPNLRLVEQSWVWAVGYGVLVLLTLGCAVVLWRAPAPVPVTSKPPPAKGKESTAIKSSSSAIQSRQGRSDTAITQSSPRDYRDTSVTGVSLDAPTWGRRINWIVLAFVPSSLMLGVTTYMTTDIAAIPLLWVMPLAIYLLTFILVFSRLPESIHKAMILTMPVAVLLLLFMMLSGVKPPKIWVTIALHLATLFMAAMVCHGDLARKRPATRDSTEFYLLMSVGGVLGGIFNALLAPILFNPAIFHGYTGFGSGALHILGSLLVFQSVPEYAFVLVLACLFLPPLEEGRDSFLFQAIDRLLARFLPDSSTRHRLVTDKGLDVVVPVAMCSISILLIWWLSEGNELVAKLAESLKMEQEPILNIIIYGLPAVMCYVFVERPLRFGLSVGAVVLAGAVFTGLNSTEIYRERSFFGVLQVEKDRRFIRLVHGTTLHGKQRHYWPTEDMVGAMGMPMCATTPLEAIACLQAGQEDYEDSRVPWLSPGLEPLTYYHHTGPVGLMMHRYSGPDATPPFAVIGLGTGSMAAYGKEGQELTYYEIDPAVERIARNPKYFTYLSDAMDRGVDLKVVLGDARLKMRQAPPEHYKVILVDAFSSDAIPIHLITHEAVQLFRSKLRSDGVLAYHISNRYLNLEPVLGNIARKEGMLALVHNDSSNTASGKTASSWVFLIQPPDAAEWEALLNGTDRAELMEKHPWVQLLDPEHFRLEPRYPWVVQTSDEDDPSSRMYPWRVVKQKPSIGLWTDDYSNLLSVFTEFHK